MNTNSTVRDYKRLDRQSGTAYLNRPLVRALLSGFALVVAVTSQVTLTTSASALVGRHASTKSSSIVAHDSRLFSVGTPDQSQPSGVAPPTTSAIPGYQLSNATSFNGNAIPAGWMTFAGTPAGDPGSQWAGSHVVVSGNMLQLNSFQDPSFNNEWVSGGICQCGNYHKYGAFFVRSRVTGPGPTQVLMLWPRAGWPPEIDFSETYGGTSLSQATLHYSSANAAIHINLDINMTLWHTWGVVWTPTSISYTVDGKVWGSITDPSIIPDHAMALHIQQQTWCSASFACPTSAQSTQVNWVAEYSSLSPLPIAVGSFIGNSTLMSTTVKARVRHLAKVVSGRSATIVTITGYANGSVNPVSNLAVSRQRAINVKKYLLQQLALLNDTSVSVVAIGAGGSDLVAFTANVRANSGKVLALLR